MLSKKIGIDLGTSTVLIYVKGEGIVVNEPSLVAVNRDGTRILAVGRQAFEMVGRAPDTIQVVRPMRDGVIADFVVTEGMLHHFIGKVQGRQRIFTPRRPSRPARARHGSSTSRSPPRSERASRFPSRAATPFAT